MTPSGTRAVAVVIAGGVIESVREGAPAGAPVVDLGDSVLMPGLVDTHVHVNEPGRTDWEGFETATRAAAAGGVTTIFDMPLNSVPATTSADAMRVKLATAGGKCSVDVGFWGGLVPGNAAELRPMKELGAPGLVLPVPSASGS